MYSSMSPHKTPKRSKPNQHKQPRSTIFVTLLCLKRGTASTPAGYCYWQYTATVSILLLPVYCYCQNTVTVSILLVSVYYTST